MKTKLKPRIDLKNRTKLESVIPLSVPYVIFVDPSDKCNFQCKFCPTGDKNLMKNTQGRNHGDMDYNLYKKIINDIVEFEKPIKVLRLYKDGEPLLNPRFTQMIKYAKEKKCSEKIDTTTNASLLNPKLNREIIAAGIDRINISIEGINADQYFNFSRYKINFSTFIENITDLYNNRGSTEIIIKINGDILSLKDKELFLEIFSKISDGVYIEHIMSCWPNFELKDVSANKKFGIYGQPINEVIVCPYPFYSISINSDGTVSLCFLDWARKLVIGNVSNESVKEIWNGRKLFEFQKMFLNKSRKANPVCFECGQMSHGLPDNIDKHADELLKKIHAKY